MSYSDPMMFDGIEQDLQRDADEYLGVPKRDALPIFDLKRLKGAPPPPREFVLAGLIPEGEVTLFGGPGGAGKSLAAQQLATCVAAEIPFLGVDTGKLEDIGNAVLYITAEDDEAEMERRQRKILEATGAKDLEGKLFLSSIRGREGNELATFDRDGTLEKGETFQLLANAILDTGAQFVILDNIAHLFAGNENDRGQVTRFVNLLYSLVRIYGVTVLLVGHPNKRGETYSGSTAWLNAVRSQIYLSRVEDENGNCLDPDARVLTLAKSNYSRLGQRIEFRWHDHAFWRDDDLPEDTRKELAEAAKLAGENEIFLNCLRVRNAQGGREVGPSIGPNYAPARFAEMTEARGVTKKALARAMERLFHVGAITTKEVRREGKGATKTIIVEAQPNTPEPTPEPVPNYFPERPEPSHRTPPNIHPISKDISGAAFRAAAPVNDTEGDRRDD